MYKKHILLFVIQKISSLALSKNFELILLKNKYTTMLKQKTEQHCDGFLYNLISYITFAVKFTKVLTMSYNDSISSRIS